MKTLQAIEIYAPIGHRKGSRPIYYNPRQPNGYRWLEHASGGLRVTDCAKRAEYYIDVYCSETTRGCVILLPHGRMVPACSDPWNADAYLADFGWQFELEDRVSAEQAADDMARRYAETLRDDNEAYRAYTRREDIRAEMRERVSKRVRAMRAGLSDIAADYREQSRALHREWLELEDLAGRYHV